MNRFMAWVKSNVSIVASIAVIVLVLPAAWFGSSWWNNRIRTAREQAVEKASRDLDGVKVSYTVPSPFPNGVSVTVPSEAPNPALTSFFKDYRDKLDQQVGEVVKVAQEINQGDHKPLVEGIFPNPSDKLLTLTFIEALAGKGAEKPSAYEELLKQVNAGGPADPVALSELLAEERTQAIEKIKAERNTDKLGADDDAAIAKALAAVRLSEYKRRARSISLYATMDAFPQAPRTIPPEPPDVAECWQWQFDYWVIADLLHAVDAANRPDGKKGGGVETSVVKRIDRITVDPMALPNASQPGQPTPPGAAPAFTLTGRKGGGATGTYDLRDAEMTLVVDSARIPELLSAISRTNFMTVISLEFADLDPWAELEQGYYYGKEHVVRARLRLETVWLRSWTGPLLPESIKAAFAAAEAPPPEPPPPPPPPAAASGEKPTKSKGKPPPKPKGRPRGGE